MSTHPPLSEIRENSRLPFCSLRLFERGNQLRDDHRTSLRSKRFRKVFRTFEAFFFFALAPIFARLKNEKCLERAENLTETLATQAITELIEADPDVLRCLKVTHYRLLKRI